MNEIIESNIIKIESPEAVKEGDWFYVKGKYFNGVKLGCVTHIGTNFIQLSFPQEKKYSGFLDEKIHFNDFWTHLTYEPNPTEVFKKELESKQKELNTCMLEVRRITSALGVTPREQLSCSNDTKALVKANESDIDGYKLQLHHAKDKLLPDLFRQIKEIHEQISCLMCAELLPYKAIEEKQKGIMENIYHRIDSVDIYAGLTEKIKLCREGEPASISDKLHIMQRKLYMDEECLLNYSSGGMEFNDICEFDAWLSQDDNLNRILPFPKTMVCFQVRRKCKERDSVKLDAFIAMKLRNRDKLTLIYIRNGERLYRIEVPLVFEDKLFPSRDKFNFTEEMMCDKYGNIMPKREWDYIIGQYNKYLEWIEKNPYKEFISNIDSYLLKRGIIDYKVENSITSFKDVYYTEVGSTASMYLNTQRAWEEENPYYQHKADGKYLDWVPFNQDTVLYDTVMERLKKDNREYNKISTFVQGIYDRSEVLHPHPPAKLWEQDNFNALIKMVYDYDDALYSSVEPPDIIQYMKELNATLKVGSITVGQRHEWLNIKKEVYKPHDGWEEIKPNLYAREYEGVGYIDTVDRISKNSVTYYWYAPRKRHYVYHSPDTVKKTFRTTTDKILNIDAYKAGDYKKFFNDIRTRMEYLKWAPLLLAAEDFLAGKVKITHKNRIY